MAFITINGHTIRSNAVRGTSEPPVRIARTKSAGAEYASDVAILDREGQEVARLVYTPDSPQMKCGARLVLETQFPPKVLS